MAGRQQLSLMTNSDDEDDSEDELSLYLTSGPKATDLLQQELVVQQSDTLAECDLLPQTVSEITSQTKQMDFQEKEGSVESSFALQDGDEVEKLKEEKELLNHGNILDLENIDSSQTKETEMLLQELVVQQSDTLAECDLLPQTVSEITSQTKQVDFQEKEGSVESSFAPQDEDEFEKSKEEKEQLNHGNILSQANILSQGNILGQDILSQGNILSQKSIYSEFRRSNVITKDTFDSLDNGHDVKKGDIDTLARKVGQKTESCDYEPFQLTDREPMFTPSKEDIYSSQNETGTLLEHSVSEQRKDDYFQYNILSQNEGDLIAKNVKSITDADEGIVSHHRNINSESDIDDEISSYLAANDTAVLTGVNKTECSVNEQTNARKTSNVVQNKGGSLEPLKTDEGVKVENMIMEIESCQNNNMDLGEKSVEQQGNETSLPFSRLSQNKDSVVSDKLESVKNEKNDTFSKKRNINTETLKDEKVREIFVQKHILDFPVLQSNGKTSNEYVESTHCSEEYLKAMSWKQTPGLVNRNDIRNTLTPDLKDKSNNLETEFVDDESDTEIGDDPLISYLNNSNENGEILQRDKSEISLKSPTPETYVESDYNTNESNIKKKGQVISSQTVNSKDASAIQEQASVSGCSNVSGKQNHKRSWEPSPVKKEDFESLRKIIDYSSKGFTDQVTIKSHSEIMTGPSTITEKASKANRMVEIMIINPEDSNENSDNKGLFVDCKDKEMFDNKFDRADLRIDCTKNEYDSNDKNLVRSLNDPRDLDTNESGKSEFAKVTDSFLNDRADLRIDCTKNEYDSNDKNLVRSLNDPRDLDTNKPGKSEFAKVTDSFLNDIKRITNDNANLLQKSSDDVSGPAFDSLQCLTAITHLEKDSDNNNSVFSDKAVNLHNSCEQTASSQALPFGKFVRKNNKLHIIKEIDGNPTLEEFLSPKDDKGRNPVEKVTFRNKKSHKYENSKPELFASTKATNLAGEKLSNLNAARVQPSQPKNSNSKSQKGNIYKTSKPDYLKKDKSQKNVQKDQTHTGLQSNDKCSSNENFFETDFTEKKLRECSIFGNVNKAEQALTEVEILKPNNYKSVESKVQQNINEQEDTATIRVFRVEQSPVKGNARVKYIILQDDGRYKEIEADEISSSVSGKQEVAYSNKLILDNDTNMLIAKSETSECRNKHQRNLFTGESRSNIKCKPEKVDVGTQSIPTCCACSCHSDAGIAKRYQQVLDDVRNKTKGQVQKHTLIVIKRNKINSIKAGVAELGKNVSETTEDDNDKKMIPSKISKPEKYTNKSFEVNGNIDNIRLDINAKTSKPSACDNAETVKNSVHESDFKDICIKSSSGNKNLRGNGSSEKEESVTMDSGVKTNLVERYADKKRESRQICDDISSNALGSQIKKSEKLTIDKKSESIREEKESNIREEKESKCLKESDRKPCKKEFTTKVTGIKNKPSDGYNSKRSSLKRELGNLVINMKEEGQENNARGTNASVRIRSISSSKNDRKSKDTEGVSKKNKKPRVLKVRFKATKHDKEAKRKQKGMPDSVKKDSKKKAKKSRLVTGDGDSFPNINESRVEQTCDNTNNTKIVDMSETEEIRFENTGTYINKKAKRKLRVISTCGEVDISNKKMKLSSLVSGVGEDKFAIIKDSTFEQTCDHTKGETENSKESLKINKKSVERKRGDKFNEKSLIPTYGLDSLCESANGMTVDPSDLSNLKNLVEMMRNKHKHMVESKSQLVKEVKKNKRKNIRKTAKTAKKSKVSKQTSISSNTEDLHKSIEGSKGVGKKCRKKRKPKETKVVAFKKKRGRRRSKSRMLPSKWTHTPTWKHQLTDNAFQFEDVLQKQSKPDVSHFKKLLKRVLNKTETAKREKRKRHTEANITGRLKSQSKSQTSANRPIVDFQGFRFSPESAGKSSCSESEMEVDCSIIEEMKNSVSSFCETQGLLVTNRNTFGSYGSWIHSSKSQSNMEQSDTEGVDESHTKNCESMQSPEKK